MAQLGLIIFALCLGASVAVDFGGRPLPQSDEDGQPGCRTRREFGRFWRNHEDPTRYWECVAWAQGAESRNCPPFTQFQEEWQTCVPEHLWQWSPPLSPPSRPTDTVNPCEPLDLPTPCPPGQTTTPCPPCPPEGETTTLCPPCPDVPPEEPPPGEPQCVGPPPITGGLSCNVPACTIDEFNRNVLFPSLTPTQFYQCAGVGFPVVMPCSPGTCFQFEQQVCVHPSNWTNTCSSAIF
ncbi:peritrophin-55-like [Phlebotomus papatasi]|uniref:peritrophin-55-like n=1 Tax=Phlebotomus papatasi TaxID=29031 RepID=UPI0024844D2F|nr:peritrophin-55-like [Phlebotomus papatasi]